MKQKKKNGTRINFDRADKKQILNPDESGLI
jgi:hypothetical protein